MKNVLKAVSYVDSKHSTIVYSALVLSFFSSSCLHFIKVSVGWLAEIRYHHKGGRGIEIKLKKETGQRERWRRVEGRLASLRERAKLRSVEGFSLGRGPASSNSSAFAESCRSDKAGLR